MLVNAGSSLGIQQRGARNLDLDGSAAYLQFFAMTLEFGVFPHAPHHSPAEVLCVRSELDFGELATQHVRDYIQDCIWKYAGLIDKISVALATVFQRVGRCRYPLYRIPPTYVDIFG